MPKRHHVHKGSHIPRSHSPRPERANIQPVTIQNYVKVANKYLRKAYNKINESYVAIFTILFVILLSFLLPDISNKIHKTNELKEMKSTLDLMKREVNNAEVACLAVADDFCFLQCSMRDDQTETSNELRDLSVCTRNSMRDTQSEPMQVEKKVGLFRRIFFPNRNASHKEIAIMSFLYSDDALATSKTVNYTDALSTFVLD